LGVLRALGDRAGEGDRRPLSSAFPATPTETAKTEAQPLSRTRVDVTGRAAAAWLTGTMFLAPRVLYFIGLDQGATSSSVLTPTSASSCMTPRHLLGHPCH
jgi:hypothetical protein